MGPEGTESTDGFLHASNNVFLSLTLEQQGLTRWICTEMKKVGQQKARNSYRGSCHQQRPQQLFTTRH
jgi:hypothetical protein